MTKSEPGHSRKWGDSRTKSRNGAGTFISASWFETRPTSSSQGTRGSGATLEPTGGNEGACSVSALGRRLHAGEALNAFAGPRWPDGVAITRGRSFRADGWKVFGWPEPRGIPEGTRGR